LIKSGDDRYDWVGGFLVREGGNTLWLHNYVGSSSEQAEFAVGTGIGGSAVASRENRIVGDISTVEGYISPAPDSRSEIFVLIRAGGEVFGGIGVSSEEASTFTEKDEIEIQAVADKIAEQMAAERR
jgi:putative methionine-R-sulfoxide reductase with GAF domain